MKIIGLTPLYDVAENRLFMLRKYIELIERNGAYAVILPFNSDRKFLEEIVNRLDGIVFTGGLDVAPSYYNEDKILECGISSYVRDELEFNLMDICYKKDIPTLGICRGLQIMNVYLGGTLYQDLKKQKDISIIHSQDKPYNDLVHEVTNYGMFKEKFGDRFYVNSLHHQAIKDVADELEVLQKSSDDIVEAAYVKDKKFFLGVQYHPEMALDTLSQGHEIVKMFLDSIK